MKTCTKCRRSKPTEEFYENRGRPSSWCKQCNRDRQKSYYRRHRSTIREREKKRKRENRLKARDTHLRYMYGITLEQFNALAESQQGRCAICRRKRKLAVDHDHETGAIRGLLCRPCNSGLGLLGDSLDGVRSALEYLQRYRNDRQEAGPGALRVRDVVWDGTLERHPRPQA
jgi:hypothetical protein